MPVVPVDPNIPEYGIQSNCHVINWMPANWGRISGQRADGDSPREGRGMAAILKQGNFK